MLTQKNMLKQKNHVNAKETMIKQKKHMNETNKIFFNSALHNLSLNHLLFLGYIARLVKQSQKTISII